MSFFSIKCGGSEQIDLIRRRLCEFNSGCADHQETRSIDFVLTDPESNVIGGVSGFAEWDWCFIELLWVDESYRGAGLGSRLLNHVEVEAQRFGCVGACLLTFSFQAPSFYTSRGYSINGEIDNYPKGHRLYLLSKALNS